jgi:hypothetical protein
LDTAWRLLNPRILTDITERPRRDNQNKNASGHPPPHDLVLGNEPITRLCCSRAGGLEVAHDHGLDGRATTPAATPCATCIRDGLAAVRALFDGIFDLGSGDTHARAEVHETMIMKIVFIFKERSSEALSSVVTGALGTCNGDILVAMKLD